MRALILFTAFFLSLFSISSVVAAPPTDTEAARLLAGTWVATDKPGVSDATMIFRPDGTFLTHATLNIPGGPIKFQAEGKWRMEGGVLIEELTRSSHPNLAPVGLLTRDTLTSVTADEYRYRTERGEERGYARRTDAPKPNPNK